MLNQFKQNKKKGFTLIELVIVIAIIGVLSVVTVPKLNSFINKANGAGVTIDFKSSFLNVVEGYVIENHALPTEEQLATDLSEFACISAIGADIKPFTTDDTIGKLTFINGTDNMDLFGDGELFPLLNKRVAYLGGEGGKKYAVTLANAGTQITFIAGHVTPKLAMKTTLTVNDATTINGLAKDLVTTSQAVVVIPPVVVVYSPESDFAFDGSGTITSYLGLGGVVNIPSTIGGVTVTSIGSMAFISSESLTSITIPNGVTTIGVNAFNNCTNLKDVSIPNSVTSIGNQAFMTCTSLTSIVIPSGVTIIGEFAFSSCTSLTSIVIPSSVTSIGDGLFSSCTSLNSLIIQSGVITIKSYTFFGCSNLTSIVIPSSVTNIGEEAFGSCPAMTIKISGSQWSLFESSFPVGSVSID